MRTQPPPPPPAIYTLSLGAFSLYRKVEYCQVRLYGPQDLEYLSSGHLQKEFTDPWLR